MQTITIEPLRWQEDPSRITIHANDSQLAVYYQVTSPKSVAAVCCGRPVEELPRLLPILAPSHHLAAALALDRLFAVDPPELAQNMRAGLLQAQYCSSHLRQIFFLLTSRQDPFSGFHDSRRRVSSARISQRMPERIMHHAALAQEAEDILGGRHDHPLTAVAGGVSRFLKDGYYERLADLSASLLNFSLELAEFMRSDILSAEGLLSPWSNVELPTLPGLCLSVDGQPSLCDPAGGSRKPFDADQLGAAVDLQQEAWSYQPFAYLKEKEWKGVDASDGFFLVGPLARFNAAQTASTPLAEEERQRMIECLGTPPVYRLPAAFGAMTIELVQAAEMLQALSSVEKLTGPALRTIPDGIGQQRSTWAALEGPRGLTWHQYQVDDNGIVENVTVLDARAANNAFKCRLAKQIVGAALARDEKPAVIKDHVSVALLPF
jgi:coenzyme F420-reducing hydrogenase alpha subunit